MSQTIPKFEFEHSEVSVFGTNQMGTIVFTEDVADDETVTFIEPSTKEKVTLTAYMLKYNNYTSIKIITSTLEASKIYICS